MELFLFAAVVVFAGSFAFINGFHDVSNAVATAVRTRALTPSIAVVLVAFFNFAGAMISTGLALLVSEAWIGLPEGPEGLGILIAGLLSACGWGIYTWWRRMPSSSTHALVGGLVGSGAASAFLGGHNIIAGDNFIGTQIVLPLLLSPVIAFAISYVVVFPLTWISRYTAPKRANETNRMIQSILAGAFALGHGLQDGQRTMAVLLLALVAAGLDTGSRMPLWVQLFAATLLAAGSLFGGWRLSHTLGYRLVRMDPLRGAVAQGVSSAMLFFGGMALHIPLSSTHTMTSSILGAGANQRFDAVRWRVANRVFLTWVLTAVATATMGAVLYLALDPLL